MGLEGIGIIDLGVLVWSSLVNAVLERGKP